jgi:alpha-L-fucosidase
VKNYRRLIREASDNNERIRLIAEAIEDDVLDESLILEAGITAYVGGMLKSLLGPRPDRVSKEIELVLGIPAEQVMSLPDTEKKELLQQVILKSMDDSYEAIKRTIPH